MNVGDPASSSKEVSANKCKSEEAEKYRRAGSQMDRSTRETGNDGGGKDPG
jgi:hypothetical protein